MPATGISMKFEGTARLTAKLKAQAAKYVGQDNTVRPAVEVGYTAAYALYVHENMEIWPPGMRLKGLPRGLGFSQKDGVVFVPKGILAGTAGGAARGFYWDPQGKAQPKFLESVVREDRDAIWRAIFEGLKAGMTLAQALLKAGLLVQRNSMQRVPVDTGHLKSSAYTRLVTIDKADDNVSELRGVDQEGNYFSG